MTLMIQSIEQCFKYNITDSVDLTTNKKLI